MICDVIKSLRIFICFPKEVSVNKSDRREPHNENVMELKLNEIRSLGIGASSLRVRQLWPRGDRLLLRADGSTLKV